MTETSTIYQQLQGALSEWLDLPEPQWNDLAKIFGVKIFAPSEFVALPGERKHELLFVSEGLLRFYYVDSEGTESNKAFVAENTFAGSPVSFLLGLPTVYGIQALEKTTLLIADYADFNALLEQHPVFDRLGRIFAERLLIRKELRARSLLEQNATERYLNFVKNEPQMLQRVPQFHIASYLGITEVSLSRLRGSLAKKAVP